MVTRAFHGGIGALKKGKKRIDKEAKQREKERKLAEKGSTKRSKTKLLKQTFAEHKPIWAGEAGTLLR